jgi:hypothetical protein
MPININSNIIKSTNINASGTFYNSIIREGLQCHYDINNSYSWSGSGTWNNIANNHTALTVNGGMGTATFGNTKAWNMNADGAYLNGTYAGTQPYQYCTLEAWIYPGASEVTSGDRGTIILLTGGNGLYMSWNKSNQYMSCYWYGSTNNGYWEQNGPTSRSGWAHWCAVWDPKAGNIYQYVNGTSVGIGATINSASTGTNFLIGREGSSRQFSGGIAEIRVYNRSLHPHEVIQNYLADKPKYL